MKPSLAEDAVRLRPAQVADRDCLLAIYASTRVDELALTGWTDDEKESFVAMQFAAQDHHYRRHFPHAEYSLIEVGGQPVGRLYLDRRPDEIRILDITLLPPARCRGIGTRLLTAVIAEAEAAGRAVRIHVEVTNRARALYERLGFVKAGQAGVHILLERLCATSPA